MLLALDDTDGPHGGCTTHLAGLILDTIGPEHATGPPRLVRLHPSHPWKTRGNAAIVLELADTLDPEPVLDAAFGIVEARARITEGKGAGLALFPEPPDRSWYEQGVQASLARDAVDDALAKIPTRTLGTGRGLIGCLCAAAWQPDAGSTTWTRIAYRRPDAIGTPRTVDPASIEHIDETYPEVFDAWDAQASYPVMVPRTPCPVLYGLRATRPDRLDPIAAQIKSEPEARATTFVTNQASDDHLGMDALVPLRASQAPSTIDGGHVRVEGTTRAGKVRDVLAFEPTGRLRHALLALEPGDQFLPVGELRDGRGKAPSQVNLEKLLHVPQAQRATARCPGCQSRLASMGQHAPLRCPRCGHREAKQTAPSTPRWSEVDPSARRHLARPLALGLADPVQEAATSLLASTLTA